MAFKPTSRTAPVISPLHTSLAASVTKAGVIAANGRDSDGAFRATNRLDAAKKDTK